MQDSGGNANIKTIRLSGLVMDPRTQIRTATCWPTVTEYQEAMRVGVEFGPITVCMVDEQDEAKGFILIDGWHRVSATQALGRTNIDAKVLLGVRPQEYRWLAAQGNRCHGLRLTRHDRRNVFRAYVQARQHREGNRGNRIKSAREMAKDLQGIVTDRRIPVWMKEDFPGVYRQMLKGGLAENPTADFGRKDVDPSLVQIATAKLDEFMATLRAITSDEVRIEVARQITATAQDAVKVATGELTLPPAAITDDEF